jgi:hypothetical protein
MRNLLILFIIILLQSCSSTSITCQTQSAYTTFSIDNTGVDTSNVSTADDEAKYTPTDPPTETSTTGGGASGQTIATGEGVIEITPGQFRNEGAGLARGASPTAGDAQQ